MSNSEKIKEFYANDIVYKFDKRKRIVFGVVIDSYEAYSEDVDENEALQKGQIKVLWNNSSREQVWRQDRVHLVHRNIIPGEIVRRLENGKETQRGYCKETKQVATVQIVGTDKVVEHVSYDRLSHVRPYDINDAVCLGDKFGRIASVEEMVTMESKCGSIVNVLTSINHELDDYWLAKRNRLSLDVYYPGQEIICIPSYLEQPTWIKKTKSMKRNMQTRQRFTVQNVEDVCVEIVWYDNSPMQYWHISEIFEENIKRLKVLEDPGETCLELAERRLLKLSPSDTLLKKKDWLRKLTASYRSEVPKIRHVVSFNSKLNCRLPKIRSSSFIHNAITTTTTSEGEKYRQEDGDEWWTDEDDESEEDASVSSHSTFVAKSKKRHYPPKAKELIAGHTLPVEVIYVESKVTVVWQDGTEEKDIPSTQLYYSISLDDHEFFPGEWVVSENGNDTDKYGVIQNVNYLERTANIKWFTYSEVEKKSLELAINEYSVYDLKKHAKYIFRPGSIVKTKPTEENKMGKVIDSCIEGYVHVLWLDGTEENCWPHNIELIPDRSSYDFSEDDSSEDDPAGVSWETESIESFAGDMTDETVLQNMAARLDFVRNRIVYLRDIFKQRKVIENFSFLKDLLLVYENCGYLDKLLSTSYFSLKSRHFQALLMQAKEKAKVSGVELKGRLFSGGDCLYATASKIRLAEKENINRMIKLENKINLQIEKKEGKEPTVPTTPVTPDSIDISYNCQDSLCLEILSMLKLRMDLAYAEIISRIGGNQALSVLTKASEYIATPSSCTPLPSCPTSPDESFSALSPLRPKNETTVVENETYAIIEETPIIHHYFTTKFEPADLQKFLKAVQKEYKLLKESLPPGVWVRCYGNRIDLLSVMICGPANTPYEDGLFLFDIQLSGDYPRSPPLVHYISYSSERLNPNLYVEGKVCVSLLGTWMGRGTEVWGPNSTLLQLIVSIQGLILVAEPYYNEAGYEKLTDTQQGYENSRTYNELVVLKLVQSMKELLQNPPEVFKQEILSHFAQNGRKLVERLKRYCSETDPLKPEFPLLPVSKGLRLSLGSALQSFEGVLDTISDKRGDNNK